MSGPTDDLVVRGIVVPGDELQWRFDTSGGPGGQHANRSRTRVTVSWDITTSPSLEQPAKDLLLSRLGHRASGGVVEASAGDSRSQWRNRTAARERLVEVLDEALAPRAPARRPTKPSRAAARRRLESKRRRSMLKRLRRKPPLD